MIVVGMIVGTIVESLLFVVARDLADYYHDAAAVLVPAKPEGRHHGVKQQANQENKVHNKSSSLPMQRTRPFDLISKNLDESIEHATNGFKTKEIQPKTKQAD